MVLNRITLIIMAFLLGLIHSSNAQDSIIAHRSARFEVGLGFGIAGEGDGLSGRIALSYLNNYWGLKVRSTAYDGGEGTYSGWFGPPKESFYDKAILLSFVIKNNRALQTIVSLGVGGVSGRRLAKPNQLEDFGPVTGVAYEFGFASTASTVGFNFGIIGNLNSESSVFGLIISMTLGYQK